MFLRSIQVANRYKIVSLPMDILMKNKVSQEAVLRSSDSEELKNAVFEIASRANSHLEKVSFKKCTIFQYVRKYSVF